MGLAQLRVMYGHLEGSDAKFARDPSGYLSIETGIYRRHGLEVSWEHVQGTEERYHKLARGDAQISFVVGRASLQHYLVSKRTCLLGCAMNSCPYFLVVNPEIENLGDLKGKAVACREEPAAGAPLAETFQARGGLTLKSEVKLQLPKSDQAAFEMLRAGQVQGAFLPRPYALLAEERGFKRMAGWPEVIDDPLPITIETSDELREKHDSEFSAFVAAHREGIGYLKSHRAETIGMLQGRFGHSQTLAAKTFDDYLVCMNEALTVDFSQLAKLIAQVAPEAGARVRKIATKWVLPGSLRE